MSTFKGVGSMENGMVNGVVSFPGGVYGDLNINGVATVEGPLEAGVLDIDGVFNARSDVNCQKLKTAGVVTIDGNLRAGQANVDGVVSVHGTKVEADRILCDGILNVDGQVSADVIDAQGFINANEIVGDRISIQSFTRSFFFRMWVKLKEAVGSQDYSKVELIEATTINLRGVHARTVSGHDITIGPACKIDRVDASGELYIDEDAEVREVVNNKE
jgi:cytoskeletal protein CcmA (bactofilin family)